MRIYKISSECLAQKGNLWSSQVISHYGNCSELISSFLVNILISLMCAISCLRNQIFLIFLFVYFSFQNNGYSLLRAIFLLIDYVFGELKKQFFGNQFCFSNWRLQITVTGVLINIIVLLAIKKSKSMSCSFGIITKNQAVCNIIMCLIFLLVTFPLQLRYSKSPFSYIFPFQHFPTPHRPLPLFWYCCYECLRNIQFISFPDFTQQILPAIHASLL